MDLNRAMEMAKEMRSALQQQEEALAVLTAKGEAGAGMVEIHMDGKYHITKVHIAKEALQDSDPHFVGDLVRAAANQARCRIAQLQKEKMQSLATQLKFEDGLLPPLEK